MKCRIPTWINKLITLQNNLKDLYERANEELKMAVVIVSKRINVRLFANRQNPAPGTVVDDVITNPHRYRTWLKTFFIFVHFLIDALTFSYLKTPIWLSESNYHFRKPKIKLMIYIECDVFQERIHKLEKQKISFRVKVTTIFWEFWYRKQVQLSSSHAEILLVNFKVKIHNFEFPKNAVLLVVQKA